MLGAAMEPAMDRTKESPLAVYQAHLDKGELAYQWSPQANKAVFYPRLFCPFTGSRTLEWRISKGLGTVYATLGSAVTVVEMTPGLLPGADRDLVDILAKRVKQTMKSVLLETKVVQMKPEAGGVRVAFEGNVDQKEQRFDRVLVSVGRRPNSKIPGLEKTQVQVDQRGFIMVDEQRRTHEPSIFAIGDVVGEPMLAHKASHEGRVAVEVMAGENVAFSPRAIPAVVFTDPELAWAGLTEAQAAKDGGKIHRAPGDIPGVGRFAMERMMRRLEMQGG